MPACEPKFEKRLLGSLCKARETNGWMLKVDKVNLADEGVFEQ